MTDMMVTTSNLPSLVATPQEWAVRRQQFNDWANTQLRRGVDFGVIPNTDKPTLLKPGAEKIAQLFGCAPELDEVHRDQDPNTGYLYIEYRCRLMNLQTGQILAHGVGACSSWESKYRWRWEYYNGKGNPPEGEGWDYGQAKSGRSYWRRRIENRDLIDQWNTVLKMAKKRALVDAALTVSGASEKFTQDLEDMPEFQGEPEQQAPAQPAPAPSAQPETVRIAWDGDGNSQAKFEGYLQTNSVDPADFYAFMEMDGWPEYIAQTPTKSQAVKDANAYMTAKKAG